MGSNPSDGQIGNYQKEKFTGNYQKKQIYG